MLSYLEVYVKIPVIIIINFLVLWKGITPYVTRKIRTYDTIIVAESVLKTCKNLKNVLYVVY